MTRPPDAPPSRWRHRLRLVGFGCLVYGGVLVLAELVLYGMFRIGLLTEFDWWQAPARLLPLLLVLGWLQRRQERRLEREHKIVCSMREPAVGDQGPPSWRRGEAVLSPGRFTFSPPHSVVVPAGPGRTIAVDSVTAPEPERPRGLLRVLKPVVVVLHGPDGDHEVRVAAGDVDRLRAEVTGGG